jgi:hypothetical protein
MHLKVENSNEIVKPDTNLVTTMTRRASGRRCLCYGSSQHQKTAGMQATSRNSASNGVSARVLSADPADGRSSDDKQARFGRCGSGRGGSGTRIGRSSSPWTLIGGPGSLADCFIVVDGVGCYPKLVFDCRIAK